MSMRSDRQPVTRPASTGGGAAIAAAVVAVLLMTASLAVAFQRTEDRQPCASYDPLRQPFFGETHLHTGLSFDASIRFVRPTPRDAYRFAKGGSVVGTDPNGFPTRIYTQDRPLDFAAVTDHSEHFGEMGVCKSADLPGRFSFECQLLNGFWWQPGLFPGSGQRSLSTAAFNLLGLSNVGPSTLNTHLPMCVNGQADCVESEQRMWDEIQAAAEEAYDRTSRCSFTSFIAYEMTSTPLGQNWHRNVIFRNDRVVPRPITAIDMARRPNPDPNTVPPRQIVLGGPDVEKLWEGLRTQCLEAGNGCDVLTIPHNSNLAGARAQSRPCSSIRRLGRSRRNDSSSSRWSRSTRTRGAASAAGTRASRTVWRPPTSSASSSCSTRPASSPLRA